MIQRVPPNAAAHRPERATRARVRRGWACSAGRSIHGIPNPGACDSSLRHALLHGLKQPLDVSLPLRYLGVRNLERPAGVSSLRSRFGERIEGPSVVGVDVSMSGEQIESRVNPPVTLRSVSPDTRVVMTYAFAAVPRR